MKVTPDALLEAISAADERVIENTAPKLFECRADSPDAFLNEQPEAPTPNRRINRIVTGVLTAAAAAACIICVTVLLPKIGKENPPTAESSTAATTTQTDETTLTTETTLITETTAEPNPYNDLYFDIRDKKAYVTDFVFGQISTFIVPETFRGVPVVGIDDEAFRDCQMEEITLPESLVSIGTYAFMDCENLKSISIPDSVTTIGHYAFIRCTSLENVRLSKNLTRIGVEAFDGTPWLDQKKIENPLVIANDILLDGSACTGKVVIPDGITIIAGGAFQGDDYDPDKYGDVFINTSLTSVIFPPSLNVICEYAFKDCVHLESVTFADGLKEVGDYAFSGCYDLQTISLPITLKHIGNCAFECCRQIKDLNIPDGVESIGNEAFCGMDALTSVTLPDKNDIHIGDAAFAWNYNLTSVTAEAMLNRMSRADLKEIFSKTPWYNDNYGIQEFRIVEGVLLDAPYDYSVIVPDNVKEIASNVFHNGTTRITVPDSVINIDKNCVCRGDCYEYVVFCGKKGSYVEDFAKENGYRFEPID